MKEEIKKQIKAHSLENPSIECCGLLIFNEKTKQLEILKSPNLSECKESMFSLSPNHYLKASLMGKIIAVYHSHPKGENFSEFDISNSELNKIKYILYCIETDTFKEYIPNGYNNPYYGREFSLGSQDCLTLCAEYYKKELGLDFKNYHRDYNWFRDNPDCYQKYYKDEGFELMLEGQVESLFTLKKSDCILIKFLGKNNPTHAGVYVGDGLILHHQLNCYSRIEPYNQVFRNRTTHVLRHKSLL